LEGLAAEGLVTHDADNTGATPLHYASLSGSIEAVLWLINHGAPLDAADNHGALPIHYAALRGHIEIVEFFTKQGVNGTVTDSAGAQPIHYVAYGNFAEKPYTYLQVLARMMLLSGGLSAVDSRGLGLIHYAACGGNAAMMSCLFSFAPASIESTTHVPCAEWGGNIEVLRRLLDKTALVHKIDRHELTVAHTAAHSGDVQLLYWLGRHGVSLDEYDRFGHTPLNYAIIGGHIEAMRFLFETGAASIRELDGFGNRPFHSAVSNGKIGVMEYLISRLVNINETNMHGAHALHVAAAHNQLDALVWINNRAEPHNVTIFNECTDLVGRTPMHYAAANGSLDILEGLVLCGVDLNRHSAVGYTPLHEALVSRHDDAAKFLLNNGARVEVITGAGVTPLHYAALAGNTDLIDQLLSIGGSSLILKEDNEHRTPIDWAARSKRYELVCKLLSLWPEHRDLLTTAIALDTDEAVACLLNHGFNATRINEDGDQPIHEAARRGSERTLRALLVANRKNARVFNARGLTPVHVACEHDQVSMLEILFAEGAPFTIMSREGIKPLHYATLHQRRRTIEYLLSRGAIVNEHDGQNHTALDYAKLNERNRVEHADGNDIEPIVDLLITRAQEQSQFFASYK